jgi:methyl-accepting chemotaxis protein
VKAAHCRWVESPLAGNVSQVQAQTIRLHRCMANAANDGVSEAIEGLDVAFRAASTQVKADLERARAVVRDATARIDRSFQALRTATMSHREMLQSVTSALQGADSGAGFAQTTEALVRQFVDEIVRVSRDSMRIMVQLEELQVEVGSIAGCADTIDGLARETRFIAFNARIETHRAGEAGRTFKVVADEVKRLAHASSNLSSQIRQGVVNCQTQLGYVRKTATGLASHDISKAIESHKGLSAAISQLDTVNSHMEQMLSDLESNISQTVLALQFEDMVSQLIAGSITRVERMTGLAVEALHVMERGHNGDRAQPLNEVLRTARTLTQNVAVKQESMDQGSVELF